MYHNNFDLQYKNPFGAVKAFTKVYIRLDVTKKYNSCKLRIWTPDQREELYEMSYINNYYEIIISMDIIGLSWYVFILEDTDNNYRFYGCEQDYTAGKGMEYDTFPRRAGFQITCYSDTFKSPDWYTGCIIYQIFPDRFSRNPNYTFHEAKYKKIHENWNEPLGSTPYGADNFEFFGGNLLGIEDKLTYLKELNINLLYFNPIFKSKSNHRYDVSTYLDIDEMLGTIEDFQNFVTVCHEKDIRVILDVSWNHVGADSIYFNKYKTFGKFGAFNDVHSAYRDWFDIKADGSYSSWWGIDSLPVLNKNNETFKFHVKEVIEHWVSQGVDGFRLDVIDELPDNFLEWFRHTVKDIDENLIIVGETWEDASTKKDWTGRFRTFLYGNSQDSVMNYPLRNMLIDFLAYGRGEKEISHYSINAETFYRKYMNLYNNYPKEMFFGLMNFLSTHDINRIISMFGNCPYNGNLTKEEQGRYVLSKEQYELAIKRLKIAWSFIICSIGNPSIFYGDESGLYGFNDPFNRKPMNWDNQDIDVLNWFIEINELRSKHSIFKKGDMNFIFAHEDIIGFERKDSTQKVVYFANRGTEMRQIVVNEKLYSIPGLEYLIEFDNK